MHTQKIAVDGTWLAYEERGTGSPIALVPGAACDLRVCANQIESLSSRHRVIAYSRRFTWPNLAPGEGADASLARQVDDLAGLIRGLGIAPAHVVGHSFGGTISLFLALDHPELVRSLVLAEPGVAVMLDSFVRTGAEIEVSQTFAQALQQALASGDGAVVVKALFDYVAPGTISDLPEEIRSMLLANVPALRAERASPRPGFTSEHVRRVVAPTLVVAGDQSLSVYRRSAEFLAQRLPRGALATIPGAGHMMQLDNPNAFNEAVLKFIGTTHE